MPPELLARYRIAPIERPRAPRLKALLTQGSRVLRLAGEELRADLPLSLADRWRGWRNGFGANSFILYQLERRDPGDYLSDYAVRLRSDRANGLFNAVVRNKLVFARTMALFGLRHPRVYAWLDRGRVHDLERHIGESRARDWLTGLEQGQRRVLKPVAEGQGQGIVFLARDARGLSVNDVAIALDDLDAFLLALRGYLITDFVVQAPYAAAIYPGTTNTVRVLTLWDMDLGRPFIAAAVHRFGSSRSAPVDNFHAGRGGLSARIDPASGWLGPGATLSDANRLSWHDHHPESGAPIAGIRVEGWTETADSVLMAAARLPEAPAIGWDLVITEAGCCFLEGNSPPGVQVWQVHGPLLADPRVRRFYEAHGII
ncbi:MAG TPA: sugar-transfer associated ATP-grasp domain-containing protein [Candidatus Methylomirabilis sp.]|nr:sugar-transfer associated ATP-grasp domain-containing protein [Candidatus Methylomirabilis sp.]